VRDAIGANAVDLVIDPVGGKVLQNSVECLGYRGKIVNLGFAGRELGAGFNPVPLWFKNASLLGLGLFASLQCEYQRSYGVIAQCIERVHRGELRSVIDRSFPLQDAARAHAYAEQRSALGRVVLLPRG
jgi:NADPH2:quinone reductase